MCLFNEYKFISISQVSILEHVTLSKCYALSKPHFSICIMEVYDAPF